MPQPSPAVDAPPSRPAPTKAPKANPGKLSQQHKSPPRKIRKPIYEGELEDRVESSEIFEDETGKFVYLTRGCLLGEGGFARVYAMRDETTKKLGALKVVSKNQLKSCKNKSKLYAEIKLHRAMEHPHIVKFHSCFEDRQNVYLQMELCEHGSLLDLLRLRKSYSEPEARLLMFQLISACVYMHASSVIHRDLKPGNLFFATESSSLYGQDGNDEPDTERGLALKVGDFGLAALVKFKGDRRKTICGTPNYIAPEILFDQTNGHSFEVDIWSVGVILYALLIGKPPFYTKDVNQIYRNIKANAYAFPDPSPISASATALISQILNQNPNERPSLHAVVFHPWFSDGPFPFMIPMSALELCPDFSTLSTLQSDRFRNDYIRKLGLDSALQDEAAANANLSRSQRTLAGSAEEDGSSPELGGEERRLDGIAEEDEDEEMKVMAKRMSKTTLAGDPTSDSSQPTKSKRALGASASTSDRPTHQQKRLVSSTAVGVTLSDPIKASKERRRVEREAQSALNPGSPISELLKSARKPLYVSPRHNQHTTASNGGMSEGGNQLFQSLISAKGKSQHTSYKHDAQPVNSTYSGQQNIQVDENVPTDAEGLGQSTRAERKAKRTTVPNRIKDENNLGKQKARIASGMLDFGGAGQAHRRHHYTQDEDEDEDEDEVEVLKPTSQRSQAPMSKSLSKTVSQAQSSQNRSAPHAPVASSSSSATGPISSETFPAGMSKTRPGASFNPTIALYDACYQTLLSALGATSPEALMKLPFYHGTGEQCEREESAQAPGVFIQSWVDYTHKYGTAYALTDGSSGLYFNDGTTMVMAPDRNHFDYIFNRTGMIYQRKNYTLEPKNYPIELARKTYLLEYFEDYMFKTLKRNVKWAFRDLSRTKHLDFVVKYYRMNNAIVFKMSNDLIQINFWDHQKLLLTDEARRITLIEPDLNLKTYYIGELFKEAFELGLFKAKTKKKVGEDDEKAEDEGRSEEWIAHRDKIAFVLSKLECEFADVLDSSSTTLLTFGI
ncbi:hypothetical protein CROQUDRAFT_43458 [Cronartium quercuum f. sp. fusiforme G11]|uniref:Serine/threonine-protein kinase n=1 Tax=Cronartium quercuum f. sp. fusiforme G11 TaxID=708437 RepID=A0A9P6NMV4_9BASI|nr:hypothetical protein CROQUDRAFT_43458 [Cronartium quercuum f. sp. fusiforme G11]